jgi:hypothetical protein
MTEYRPYTHLEDTEEYIVRVFDENIDPIELKWHRDNEDRLVESLEPTDWLVQIENKLPEKMDKPIFIPRGQWHRTIKGTGKLVIRILKS